MYLLLQIVELEKDEKTTCEYSHSSIYDFTYIIFTLYVTRTYINRPVAGNEFYRSVNHTRKDYTIRYKENGVYYNIKFGVYYNKFVTCPSLSPGRYTRYIIYIYITCLYVKTVCGTFFFSNLNEISERGGQTTRKAIIIILLFRDRRRTGGERVYNIKIYIDYI